MIDVVAVELEVANIWALADGRYERGQVEHVMNALFLLQDGRSRRSCEYVTRPKGGNTVCHENPVFTDAAWQLMGECPFCGRKSK